MAENVDFSLYRYILSIYNNILMLLYSIQFGRKCIVVQ